MKTNDLINKLRGLLQTDAEDFGATVTCLAYIVAELYDDDGRVLSRHKLLLDELDQCYFFPPDKEPVPQREGGE